MVSNSSRGKCAKGSTYLDDLHEPSEVELFNEKDSEYSGFSEEANRSLCILTHLGVQRQVMHVGNEHRDLLLEASELVLDSLHARMVRVVS